jgi:hypothetical protein
MSSDAMPADAAKTALEDAIETHGDALVWIRKTAYSSPDEALADLEEQAKLLIEYMDHHGHLSVSQDPLSPAAGALYMAGVCLRISTGPKALARDLAVSKQTIKRYQRQIRDDILDEFRRQEGIGKPAQDYLIDGADPAPALLDSKELEDAMFEKFQSLK